MAKNLTQRQKQFLSQLIDIYRDLETPIHYSDLAKQLNIGKITAYEMLKLLEKQGLVEAEYYLPTGNRGPGRSEVLFQPTKEANRIIKQYSKSTADINEWEKVKQYILKELQKGKAGRYESLLNDLLVRIPRQRSPLIFITEMVTAIILTLTPIKKVVKNKSLLDHLGRIGLPGEIGLIALAGFGTALSLVEDVNINLATILLEHSGRYQETLMEMSEYNKQLLTDFTRDIIRIVYG